MYLRDKNIFYVHIPRSGGSSVEVAFGLKPPHEVVHRHKSISQFLQAENDISISDLTVFTTARNIFSRLESTFKYRDVIAKTYGVKTANISFDDYVDYIYEFFVGKSEYCFYKNPACDKEAFHFSSKTEQNRYGNYFKGDKDGFIFNASHVRPLENWLGDFKESTIFIDFKNYKKDFNDKIIRGLGFDFVSQLTHYNETPPWANQNLILSEESKAKVYEIYNWEIEKFQFNLEP